MSVPAARGTRIRSRYDDEGIQRVGNEDSEQQGYEERLRKVEGANDRDHGKHRERDAARIHGHSDRRDDGIRRRRCRTRTLGGGHEFRLHGHERMVWRHVRRQGTFPGGSGMSRHRHERTGSLRGGDRANPAAAGLAQGRGERNRRSVVLLDRELAVDRLAAQDHRRPVKNGTVHACQRTTETAGRDADVRHRLGARLGTVCALAYTRAGLGRSCVSAARRTTGWRR